MIEINIQMNILIIPEPAAAAVQYPHSPVATQPNKCIKAIY